MKRIAIIFCSMLIMINTIPVITGNFVFSDNDELTGSELPSGYTPVTDNKEIAQSFNDYCKSRDAWFTSNEVGATYTYVYNYMKDAVKAVTGESIDELQEYLYVKRDDLNAPQRWYLNSTGAELYNQLFAYLIRENDLEVGDTANKNVYSGSYTGGNLIWYAGNGSSGYYDVAQRGSYLLSESTVRNYNSTDYERVFFTFGDRPYRISYYVIELSSAINGVKCKNLYTKLGKPNSSGAYQDQSVHNLRTYDYNSPTNITDLYVPCIVCRDTYYYYGAYCLIGANSGKLVTWESISAADHNAIINVNINLTSDNQTINNNTYNGPTTYNIEGDVINEGDDNGDNNNPINYNPYPDHDPNDGTPTTTPSINPNDPNNTNNTNIDFPDIDLDLPSIDWSIGDLSNKFPFSIPFDLYAMFSILNTDPSTPEIAGTVDLGIYEWSINWDLHQFDDTAELLRNVEFIGFVIGLIFATRSIIKG